ncbi:MAG TPA: Ni/Fe hydrogenase subunit alpha [Gaiellaceae bacterium]|nr:Ni/Fe hydrogenase subunit alpha [Gaiellaceae bacterium]
MAAPRTRTIRTHYLARVEGEGAMLVRLRGDEVADVQLQIYEPPRLFEAFLRGREFTEVTDITARICGICPVAYQMSSAHAMEAICGAPVTGQLRALRRLLYCGEWIESHTLHVYMLHAPDFLGYASAVELARDRPEVVERALRLKKIGNEVMTVVGGREVHPVNVRVGGFYRTPTRAELAALVPKLEWALEASLETVRLVAGLDFPELERDYEFVSLRAPGEYPIDRGRIVSSSGLDIPVSAWEEHFVEHQVARSNALHATLADGRPYLVGPLARYALNGAELSPAARQVVAEVGLEPVVRNPFRSIVVRAVEIVDACEEALQLIAAYEEPDAPHVEVAPRAGVGHGATEAPRGILYHRYQIADDGTILEARIVPPTSQNQKTIEDDLFAFVRAHRRLPDDELRHRCEQAIRNYDPCISCATHFLRLDVERG